MSNNYCFVSDAEGIENTADTTKGIVPAGFAIAVLLREPDVLHQVFYKNVRLWCVY